MTQRLRVYTNICLASTLALAALVPTIAFAQPSADGGAFGTLLQNIIIFINDRFIPFILGIGFLFFVWGMFRYFIAGAASDDAREKGKNILIYTTVAFVMVIIFFGVVNLLTGSLNWGGETLEFMPQVVVP